MRNLTYYLCLAACSPLALHAETRSSSPSTYLGEIVLSTEERAAGSGSVTRVEGEQIERAQASTLVDVIRDVPGVNAIHRGSVLTSQPSIRGFGGNHHYPGDPATNVSVDGVSGDGGRIYQNATGMITDPALMKSVTVAMGPLASLEHGSGISAGSIAVETINGADLTGDEIGLKFRQMVGGNSNGDGWVTSSTLAWQPAQNLDFLLNYTRRAQGEQENGDGTLLGQRGFNVPNLMFKGRWRIDEANSLTFSHTRYESAERDVPYTSMMNSAVFGNVNRDREGSSTWLAWNYTPAVSSLIDLELRISRSEQISDVESLTPGKFSATAEGIYDQTTDRITLKNTSSLLTGAVSHRLRYGLDWSHQDRLRSPRPGQTRAEEAADYTRIGFFAIDNMEFGNDWQASLGLRVERQTIGDNLGGDYSATARTLGAGLEKGFGNGLSAFGSLTYTEGLASLDVYSGRYANGALHGDNVQQSRTYELGLKYEADSLFADGDSLTLGLTAYQTSIWNPMYSAAGNATLGYDMKGIELQANYAMEEGLYARGSVNFVDHTETALAGGVVTRKNYAYDPGHQLGLTVGKRFGNGLDMSWHVQAGEGVYSAARANAGWAVHDVKVSYTAQAGALEGVVFDLGIDNLFDRAYHTAISRLDEPGRNIKLNISKTF
ncbi:TonB-dependent receptor domain-containing protein [Pseudogemmobacter faecipullorum]|uniref:TonB-dependent receptor plug domain-containing protein n=1 Tax=Pseudogemmobacter faecipullorum TaxID=2755041 RepID=A0ABS8CNG2_9RHOB|nr:TonB-dependent receptor [Pseudogemmobacter faecipullorum]MCB5410931.1 TonB-dependent receptor plug domain-containing protein [Pseudogemmobacter faecipullorum]